MVFRYENFFIPRVEKSSKISPWEKNLASRGPTALGRTRFFARGLIFEDFSTLGMKKFPYLKTGPFGNPIFPFSSSETLISLSGETGQQDRIQMVEWSPVDHSLAVVVANDLYFMKDALTGGKAKRLTESGKDGLVFNGIADWLYEG